MSPEDWEEFEARKRQAKGLPPNRRCVYIGPPIELIAQGFVRQAAMPPGQPERAQPEALDAIQSHERPPRKSGGDHASTQFVRDTIKMHGGATFETAYQAVIAAIEADISGERVVFFDRAGDGYLFRGYNGKEDKVTLPNLRRSVKRLWNEGRQGRAA